ncbi:hypothetical protein ABZ807_31170 [Micromonospora sp. NPDC047548]|uniref:hypothetical protein n=1 Tax=Micromonospora sp. NPDC047548 TaxID=3155624 RepID=UPI0033F81C2D
MSASQHTHPDPRAWEGWETPPGVPGKGLLDLLAADAAGRATAMLAGSTTRTEDPLIDAVRLLASASGTPHTTQAAQLTGIPEDDLRRLALAYRHGGTAGVSAAIEATPCGPDEMSAAVDEVHRRRTFAVGELSIDAGTITDAGAGVRLRLGPDGRWYPFTLARRQWWPANGANASAGAAYQAAARARSLRRANG